VDKLSRYLAFGPITDRAVDPAQVVHVDSSTEALTALASGGFDAVIADPSLMSQLLIEHQRNQTILNFAERGLSFLDPSGVIVWSNSVLTEWCGGDPTGRPLLVALGNPTIASDQLNPFTATTLGYSPTFRIHRVNSIGQPYLDVRLHAIADSDGVVRQLLALCRNVTAEVEQQKKLDALHWAGRDLAALNAADLTDMNVTERVALLRHNLRRYVHDLLKYDVIEVRLLDRQTGELKPLLEEGMTKIAAARQLYARPTGNGVTGFVAHTGKSYLCADAANDPHYIQGAAGARSSMTIPLVYDEQVVGTLNVESPRVNGFGPDDLQFTELFSREIAAALHTLDLLSAQQNCTVSASIDAVHREVAIPVDDILASAELLLAKLGADDEEASSHLRRIVSRARNVKDSICKVGREMGSVSTTVGPLATLAAPPLTGKRILVIDPDERMRRQAHLVIGRLGATVETAGTATEGLALANGSEHDAILMDIRPPDMGGYETYRRLREACPGIQVAMTTGFGYDSGHAILKARQEGMKFLLFKPYRPDQVIRAVLTPPNSNGASLEPAAVPAGETY